MDPHERAMAHIWALYSDYQCQDASKDVFLAMGEKQEKAIKCLEETLEVLEKELKGKRFFTGQSIGYLDLALGWIAFWLGVSEEVACYKVLDVKKFPQFVTWIENFLKVPVIRDNLPDRDKTVEFFHENRKLQQSALGNGLAVSLQFSAQAEI